MYASPYCAGCQALLNRDDAVCPHCGTPRALAPEPDSEPIPGLGAPDSDLSPAQSYLGSAIDYDTQRAIDRTKTGVALLAIGAGLGWIPAIGFIGGLLGLIGAILVILGREAFGDEHARNVGIAIVLFVIAFLAGLVLVGGVISATAQAASMPPAQAESAIVSAFNAVLLGALVISILTGPASVFFLWELLGTSGRVLILLSYVAGIFIAYWVYVTITAQVASALSTAFAVSPPDAAPILALDAQINGLKLLNAIPSLLSAVAAGIAWARIDQGEIPKELA